MPNIDLASLHNVEEQTEGARMYVQDKFNRSTDFYIHFVGIDSVIWDEIDISRIASKGREGRAELVAKAGLSWGVKDGSSVEFDGHEVSFSEENLKELFLKAPYILKQADMFIANRVNFTKG